MPGGGNTLHLVRPKALTLMALGHLSPMSELTPASRDQRRTDAEHLKLLSIFHFIGAGLAFIGILFLLGHYAIFSTFMNNPKMWDGQKQGPPPVEFFAAFKWFYVVFALWFLGSGVLNLIAGFFIRARRHRIFSLVVAAINCLHMPMGTALGVFTIIVLTRDSVRQAYEGLTPGSS